MSTIIRAVEIDVKNITVQPNNQNSANINYCGQKMLVQLPILTASYGLSIWPSDKSGGHDKIYLDLSLKDYDKEGTDAYALYNYLCKIDELIIAQCCQLKHKMSSTSKEIIKALYTPIIKHSKDNKYPPTIRLQIPRKATGEINVEIYDKSRNLMTFDQVDFKGAKVIAIVHFSNVWFMMTGKFGLTLKVQQMKVFEKEKENKVAAQMDEYAFVSDI